MDRGAWWAADHGVSKSQTQLSDWAHRLQLGFPGGSDSRDTTCRAGGLGFHPGSGRHPGEGNDNPLQYSCLENPMDRGTWWATVHGMQR